MKILFRSNADVIYTTGKFLFIGKRSESGIIRPVWTNPKSIPVNLKEAWDKLCRERGAKVWDVWKKKWIV